MSNKSTMLRSIYGVERRPKIAKSKYAFYRERELERGDNRRRSEPRFDAYLAKREQRRRQ